MLFRSRRGRDLYERAALCRQLQTLAGKTWGKVSGREVSEGQYVFGCYAPWDPDVIGFEHSLKDSLAESVVDLEEHAFKS